MNIVPAVLEQHAEEAAFLWILRAGAVHAPHYTLGDLARLDLRLDAHLDGLRIAGPAGWEILKSTLALEGPGEVFAAAVIAFESGDPKRTERVLEAGTVSRELSAALASAVGWLPPKKADRLIRSLLASSSPVRRRVGIAGAAVRRLSMEKAFLDAAVDPDPPLRARALRAIAQLGMSSHAPLLGRSLDDPDPDVSYAAAWGAALLSGDPGAQQTLQRHSIGAGRKAREALELAARRLDPPLAASWREKLARDPATRREAVVLAGAAGDPQAIPWLVEQMSHLPVARVAGEAFSVITGADLCRLDLDRRAPEDFQAGPTDDPKEENVEPDPEEDLPWPEIARIRAFWDRERSNFAPGKRYLRGAEISSESCRETLQAGRQRERAAAALELVKSQPGQPLAEVRAPGFRQDPSSPADTA